MVKVCVPFKPEHARYIIEHNARRQEDWLDKSVADQWVEQWGDKVWAYTVLVDGEPIACAGIALQEWSRGEAWALFSEKFYQHKLFIYKLIKKALPAAFHECKLRRIQAIIDTDYPENKKWIEKLGFEYEGRMKQWGPNGQDFLIYARLK